MAFSRAPRRTDSSVGEGRSVGTGSSLGDCVAALGSLGFGAQGVGLGV